MAFPTNTTPPWKSYLTTQDPADIVKSTTVAAAIGTKVDATNGQASNLTVQGGSFTGVTLDETSKLPVATTTSAGTVIAGTGLSINATGVLSVSYSYTLQPATTSTLGGIKVGSNLTVASDGTLSATAYKLAIASTTTLGGIRVGTGLSITSDGVLSTSRSSYTLPAATKTALGGIKVGDNLSVTSDGTLSATAAAYTLPAATTTALGGIKVGTNLSVTKDGTLSATAAELAPATASTLGGVKVGTGIGVTADGTISVATTDNTAAATATTLGAVIIGEGLSVTKGGVVSATGGSYTLPPATTAVLGGIKVGTGLSAAADGTLSATGGGSYTLPAATATTLGGVSVPANVGLTISKAGVLSAAIATQNEAEAGTSNVVLSTPAAVREFTQQYGLGGTYTNAVADCNTATTGGFYNYGKSTNSPVTDSYGILVVVPLGTGYVTQIAIENNSAHSYVRYQSGSQWTAWTRVDIGAIPYASATAAGTVKVGSGLAIAADGTLSASGGGGGSSAVNKVLAAAFANQQTAVASIFDDITVVDSGVYKFKAMLAVQPSKVTDTDGFSVGLTGTAGVQTVSLLGSYVGKAGTLSSGAILVKGTNWAITEGTGTGIYPLILEGVITITSSGAGTINLGIGVGHQYNYIAVVAGSVLTMEQVGTLS